MSIIRYATFSVAATNDDCTGTWNDCRVVYTAAFLIVETKDSNQTVIPAHSVIVAHGTEAR